MYTAEEVLKEYRDRFIAEMDASTVVNDFVHHGIISNGVLESIAKADGPRQRNSILHHCLLRTCTNEALMIACDIITSVQGNPKMSALGKDMQRRLESGVCTCLCVCMCNLVHLLHTAYCTPHGGSSRFGCLFMFTLWSHCYDNFLSI